MSNNETRGRCWREVADAFGKPREQMSHDLVVAHWERMAIAGALDRLAADVAAIKAQTSDIEWEAVQHFVESEKAWVKLVEEQRDAALNERDKAQAEVERLRAELAARQAANSPGISDSSPAAPQPAATAAGWLTERERRAVAYFAQVCRDDLVPDEWTDNAGVLLSLLSRAGSPPVVEVPEEKPGLGHLLHRLYRDAISRAGISWKEVPRE